MKIIKCGMNDFAQATNNRPTICFGATELINQMCSFYKKHKLWKNIVAIADNDVNKHNKDFRFLWKTVQIISVDELVDICKKNNKTILVIMLLHIKCIEVLKQLNEISDLDSTECYIYTMLPYYDTFLQIPDNVIKMKSMNRQIPKIIHYIWMGENPIPNNHLKYMESWKKHCPDYEIKLWNERNYDIEMNKYAFEAYKAGKYSFASDYMRLAIVYEYGGIYLDTDVELLKNLDDLLYYPAYFGLGLHHSINTGLGFGSSPKNKLIEEMMDVYNDVCFVNRDGTYNQNTCDFYQGEILRLNGFSGGNLFHIIRDSIIFPVEYFAPKNTGFGMMNISGNCYSIHHYEASHAEPNYRKRMKESQEYFKKILD